MIEKINHGDAEALKAFLQMYAQHILDRATLRMASAQHAREATRLTVLAIVEAAKRGEVPLEVIPWLNRLTDESCSRLTRLMRGEPEKPAQPQRAGTAQGAAPARPTQSAPVQPQPSRSAPTAAPTQSAQAQRTYAPPAKAEDYAMGASAQPQRGEPALRNQPPAQSAPSRNAQPVAPPPPRPAQEPSAPRPQSAAAPAQSAPALFEEQEAEDSGKKRRRRDKDDARVGTVFLVFFLVMVVLALIWMLLVMLMSKGYLPVMDFGFADWFNANVFPLF